MSNFHQFPYYIYCILCSDTIPSTSLGLENSNQNTFESSLKTMKMFLFAVSL